MTATMEAAFTGGMTYARFFPSDWRSGCLVLNLEEEGLYIRICMYMYDTGKCVPDEYNTAAQILRVQPLKYRKVVDSLIAKGKIIRAQGLLINERVLEEIDRYKREYAARAEAARRREEARRQRQIQEQIEQARALAAAEPTPPVTGVVTPPDTPLVTPPVTPPVSGVVCEVVENEKHNEINEGTATTGAQASVHQNPEAIIQKPEEEINNIGGVINAEHGPTPSMEFEGIRISFSDAEVRDYMLAYPELQFPEDLRKAERVVSRRLPRGSDAEVLRALEGELNNLALKNRQLAKQVHSAATSKASRVPAQDHDCFVRDGRLHVANGFEASLLEEFADGDRDRLRLELDRIGQFLPYRANGEQLKLAVRSQLAKQKSWEIKDGKPKGRAAAADDIAHMAKLAEESAKQSQQQKGRRS